MNDTSLNLTLPRNFARQDFDSEEAATGGQQVNSVVFIQREKTPGRIAVEAARAERKQRGEALTGADMFVDGVTAVALGVAGAYAQQRFVGNPCKMSLERLRRAPLDTDPLGVRTDFKHNYFEHAAAFIPFAISADNKGYSPWGQAAFVGAAAVVTELVQGACGGGMDPYDVVRSMGVAVGGAKIAGAIRDWGIRNEVDDRDASGLERLAYKAAADIGNFSLQLRPLKSPNDREGTSRESGTHVQLNYQTQF